MSHREIVSPSEFFPRGPEHNHFVLEGIEYPATREELLGYVIDAEASAETINLFSSLPERTYTSRDDVWRSIGEATRMYGGGARDLGEPRDDIGKQATHTEDGFMHP